MKQANSSDTHLFPELIDLAGRQRMLSQRIGYFLLKIRLCSVMGQAASPDDIEKLASAVELFDETHTILERGELRREDEVLTFKRVADSWSTEALSDVKNFVSSCKKVVASARDAVDLDQGLVMSLVDAVPDTILKRLQDAVGMLQDEFSERSARDASALSDTISGAANAINRIENAARYSKFVSFNARIAAGRAGHYGAEFSALSNELKNVADSIEAAADDVKFYLRDIA